MTSRCTDCNGHAKYKNHVCDAACMHACNVIYLHCFQDETRHRHCNVFDERAICVRRRAAMPGHARPCPSAYSIACLHTRRGEASDQALSTTSVVHRPREAWEALAGCIPARSSRPPEATPPPPPLFSTTLLYHHSSQQQRARGRRHSFIHSFIL